MSKKIDTIPLDDIAVRLAAGAGQAWSAMGEFPGYARTIWRDEARLQVLAQKPDSVIECLPMSWDGREGMCFVKTVSAA